jgi:MFS family permease
MIGGRAGRRTDVVGYEPMVVTGGLWLIAKLLRYAFPALFPTFRAQLGVPNTLLGVAYAVMMLLYSLMQFPSGALADRLDDVRVVAVGALLAVAGAAVFLLPVSVPLLLLGMVLVGLGTGVHKTVSVRLLTRLYPDRTGRALGVFDTFGTVGGVVAPAAVVAALSVGDWRTVFVACGVIGLGLVVALRTRVPRRAGRDDRLRDAVGELSLRSYLGPFREVRFQLFVLVTLAFAFAYNGVVAFLPLYLVEAGNLTETTGSLLYSALFAASVVQVVSGGLSDRFGRLTLSVGVLSLAAVALVGLVVLTDAGVLTLGAAVVVFGLGSHGFRPVRGAYLSAAFPEDVAGGGLGLVRTLLMGVGAVAPAVVGFVADTLGFRAGFGLLAASMALSAVFAGATVVVADRG